MSIVREKVGIRGGVQSQVQHDSAVKHVTGEAIFIDDIPPLSGEMFAGFVLSECAHATFTIDTSPLKEMKVVNVHCLI